MSEPVLKTALMLINDLKNRKPYDLINVFISHNEDENEQETCFHHITSSLQWNLFLQRKKRTFNISMESQSKLPVTIWLLTWFVLTKFYEI